MRTFPPLLLCALLAACGPWGADQRKATAAMALTPPAAAAPFQAPVAPAPDAAANVAAGWTQAVSPWAAWIEGGDGRPLLSLACEGWDTGEPRLVVTRHAPAEPGAEALLAIQGNRRILRLPVSAAGAAEWRGALPADERAEVFLGGAISATLPGGGRLELPAMGEARAVVDECRAAAGDGVEPKPPPAA